MTCSTSTFRLKLTIAYDGRVFRGWQSQAAGSTVQDHLEQAFAVICGERIIIHGAGRTDAGVHALGQVAHGDVPRQRLPLKSWQGAVNAHLPKEIRVLQVSPAHCQFHARFDCRGKIYTYRIWNHRILHPMEIGRAWHVAADLDLSVLKRCAVELAGTHDFAGFAANRGTPARDTTRTLHHVGVARRGPLVTIRFKGDGFLYRMVRLITGTMVRCALHRASSSRIREILAGQGKIKGSSAAPAEGLYLTKVFY